MADDNLKILWMERIAEFENNCEDKKLFCRNRNLSTRAFGYWYARLKSGVKDKSSSASQSQNRLVEADEKTMRTLTDNEPKWIELQIDPQRESIYATSSITVKIGKAEIKVEEGFNKTLFTNVVKLLGEIC